jgi:DNA mismatch endonuclease (patch repair protein)
MDTISKEHRSWNMSRITSKNTKPEVAVRKYFHAKGIRYRLNGKINKKVNIRGILPGKPDLVLKKYNSVIFVHGCFWHLHQGCPKGHIPKSNKEYWWEKLKNNQKRDFKVYNELKKLGFKVFIIWECELKNIMRLEEIYDKIIVL